MTQPQERAQEQTQMQAQVPLSTRLRQRLTAWRATVWWPRAVGLSLLTAGVLVGWLTVGLAVKAMVGDRDLTPVRPAAAPADQAMVDGTAAASGSPGGQVRLRWVVTNTGEVTWKAVTHRFAPEGSNTGLPVLPLPGRPGLPAEAARQVPPGAGVEVEAFIDIPAGAPGNWQPAWILTGPDGPVEGGRLSAAITVKAP